jgi:hypothetical protein
MYIDGKVTGRPEVYAEQLVFDCAADDTEPDYRLDNLGKQRGSSSARRLARTRRSAPT